MLRALVGTTRWARSHLPNYGKYEVLASENTRVMVTLDMAKNLFTNATSRQTGWHLNNTKKEAVASRMQHQIMTTYM